MSVFYTDPQPFSEPVHLRKVRGRTFLAADWQKVSSSEALAAVRKMHSNARVSGHFVDVSSSDGDFVGLEVFLGERK